MAQFYIWFMVAISLAVIGIFSISWLFEITFQDAAIGWLIAYTAGRNAKRLCE